MGDRSEKLIYLGFRLGLEEKKGKKEEKDCIPVYNLFIQVDRYPGVGCLLCLLPQEGIDIK